MISEKDLRAFLSKWPDGWKHPDIWRAIGTNEIDPVELGRAYLQHLADPREPLSILLALIDEGAFSAAEALLDNELFLERVGAEFAIHESAIRLDLTRKSIMSEASTVASIEDLIRRGRLAGASVPRDHANFQEAERWAGRDTRKADDALGAVRRLVEEAEAKHVAKLRSSIDWRNKPDEWRAAMNRALDAHDMEVAHALISADPEGDSVGLSSLVPASLGTGPFGRKDPAEICRWSLDGRGGTPDFYSKWDPLRYPSFPREVVEALFIICKGKDVREDDVAALLAGIEKLLGMQTTASAQVSVEGEYYKGMLRGLTHEDCVAFRDGEIAVYMRRKPEADKSPLLPSSYVRPEIIFSLDGSHGAEHVVLTPWDLHRCFSKPADFKINLLRVLCSQLTADEFLPHARQIPDQLMQSAREPAPFLLHLSALRSCAARVLDLGGRRTANPRVLDRLAFYASGRAALLYALLHAVLKEAEDRGIPRNASIDVDCLDSAYCTPEFRSIIRRVLLDPVEREPILGVVLAALLVAAEPDPEGSKWGESACADDMRSWLLLEDVHISTEQFGAALERLHRLHLVDISADGRIGLSRAGGGYLLLSLIGTHDYFAKAKQSFAIT